MNLESLIGQKITKVEYVESNEELVIATAKYVATFQDDFQPAGDAGYVSFVPHKEIPDFKGATVLSLVHKTSDQGPSEKLDSVQKECLAHWEEITLVTDQGESTFYFANYDGGWDNGMLSIRVTPV